MKCTLPSASEYIRASGEVAGGREYTAKVSCRPAHTGSVHHISLVIRWSFSLQNNPKNLDLSYKTDLDLLDCLGRVKLIL